MNRLSGTGAPAVEAKPGLTVAIGMVGMNAAMYGFTVAANRTLVPSDFGAVTALLGILLIGTVVALAVQAVTARRLAVAEPDDLPEVIAQTLRVSAWMSAAVGVAVAASTVVLTPLLRLPSPLLVVLAGATLVPLTMMGAQAGIAQGLRRWNLLMAIYLSSGLGRLVIGSIALLVSPTQTAAMIGIAIGGWLPVIVGVSVLRMGRTTPQPLRPLVREIALSSHVLLAYFVLSNLDALVARNSLDAHDSGLYASGLILAKAALFLPQFVSVVVFGDLARATTTSARLRAAAMVAALGGVAVLATAVLPHVALILVGGDRYEEIADELWLFALAGSILALVHLLVFDALARHAHGVAPLLWVAVVAVVTIAYGLDVHITGLVLTVAGVAGTLAVALLTLPNGTRKAQ
ncbi:MATE family efflux transporter [Aeromicrobium fastidiosum]|uniref:Polysaccharide biosynthesis protein n=1 Tax=Aeromicrobium fastidiosum TaxID=52699 RepID=A0A641ANM5_9ACTN|nr:polysaccharide biosynthesis protein [Aeromicrobium fastidiosum]KAA1378739.1 polysaccharide biosynthesis protein [Aeromicrobium fastidiosum]MBP2392271.1 O-antigen/teichoic acid export membrane protein [Aeromicrobium fastidiosum]